MNWPRRRPFEVITFIQTFHCTIFLLCKSDIRVRTRFFFTLKDRKQIASVFNQEVSITLLSKSRSFGLVEAARPRGQTSHTAMKARFKLIPKVNTYIQLALISGCFSIILSRPRISNSKCLLLKAFFSEIQRVRT